MMTRHFAAVFVAASTLLATASHGAFARSPSRSIAAPARSVAAPAADDTAEWIGESGKASYYGPAYHGRRAANGSRFDQMGFTAAHAWLPFGTKVRVILAGTSRSVIVTITDRIYSSRRVVDLSVAAARELGMIRRGIAEVKLSPV
jgi:rare lipoprotein A